MDGTLEGKIDNLAQTGYSFRIGDYISRGFALYKSAANAMIPFSLIYFFGVSLLSRTLTLSLAVSVFLSPCIIAGFYLAANKAMQGTTPTFVDCFEGFRRFADIVIVNLVANLISSLGLFCLILPGIYLIVAYNFASMFVIFLDTDFRTALRLSRKVIHANWWKMFGLFVVVSLIGISGSLVFGVGMAFTLPIMYCTMYVAFEDIVGKAVR